MERQITPFEALQKAVETACSQSALARICGVSQTAVWKWLQSSKRVPAEYVLRVEAATGIPRHWLRPDIYPADMPPPVSVEPEIECGPVLSAHIVAGQSNHIGKLHSRNIQQERAA
ncbi:hypothetical protein C1T17_16345 [Sphingobium sp. SCG-1]|uniref:transcriptional regulator n=1 Tax=Sphingobium sp. SCG-1 TaxID=2072936 RepID=UPI000CD68AB5|nr:YdaS family helix-turn-helix protein [Sphingobium sp. SCG-1]AUW59423.1 hypothetical protein C1T17_16345 [Sphingobium sp. SCG-1]